MDRDSKPSLAIFSAWPTLSAAILPLAGPWASEFWLGICLFPPLPIRVAEDAVVVLSSKGPLFLSSSLSLSTSRWANCLNATGSIRRVLSLSGLRRRRRSLAKRPFFRRLLTQGGRSYSSELSEAPPSSVSDDGPEALAAGLWSAFTNLCLYLVRWASGGGVSA